MAQGPHGHTHFTHLSPKGQTHHRCTATPQRTHRGGASSTQGFWLTRTTQCSAQKSFDPTALTQLVGMSQQRRGPAYTGAPSPFRPLLINGSAPVLDNSAAKVTQPNMCSMREQCTYVCCRNCAGDTPNTLAVILCLCACHTSPQ